VSGSVLRLEDYGLVQEYGLVYCLVWGLGFRHLVENAGEYICGGVFCKIAKAPVFLHSRRLAAILNKSVLYYIHYLISVREYF
jgi:hypothetical protein